MLMVDPLGFAVPLAHDELSVDTKNSNRKDIAIHNMTHIRKCGSTLYVGLAHQAPPTNTNFQITFLLAQLQEALYEYLAV